MQCRCEQDPVSCVPEDGYEVAMVCDNTGSTLEMDCSYTYTIGTMVGLNIPGFSIHCVLNAP